jgi:adenylate cyclase class 2
MQETEAKFYVRNLKRIESRLQELEARLMQPRTLETNIRFDLPDGGLRSEGRVLRLRQDTAARLTYKGASANDQGVLQRTEIEFIVEDFEKARLFLEVLGYRKILVYEKYRTTYELNECQVMLDELPYGNFVEIENDSIESIRGIATKLNLNWDNAIAASYHMLFERLCTARPDLNPTRLSFAVLGGAIVTAEDLSVKAGDA